MKTEDQLAQLSDSLGKHDTIPTDAAVKLIDIMDRAPEEALVQLIRGDVKFCRGLARTRLVRDHGWRWSDVMALCDAPPTNPAAANLHLALAAVDVCKLPVMSRERCIRRKEQAKLARRLFKQLGLKGISVTTPNHSMAQGVDVKLPKRDDYTVFDAADCVDWLDDPACAANAKARRDIEEILARSFPQHDDRSELVSDYFNYCWSVD